MMKITAPTFNFAHGQVESASKRFIGQFRQRFFQLSAVIAIALLQSGCVKLSGSLKSTKVFDFAKTEIVASANAPADGVTELLVGVHLKNSDNTPVPAYKPEYEITGGAIVNGAQCTTSGSDGISLCILRSTTAGSRNFVLTNAKKGLLKQIEFIENTGSQTLALVSGATVHARTSQNDKVMVSIGQPIQGAQTKTDGYTIKLSVQGMYSGKQ